ncbi:hypothetical protein BGX27_009941 [Mortierella sp. AM989]|nr:hypothetical protein BGX27_009941 [Mortierella sp. AM989]
MDYKLNPLDLPEVRIHLAQYLNTTQLAVAATVCKSWNATFISFLYSNITWGGTCKIPSKEKISTHASDIRNLNFVDDISPSSDLFPWNTVTGLKRLLTSIDDLNTHINQNLSNLIRQNQGLIEFQEHSGGTVETKECMDALLRCSNLKILSVMFANFEQAGTTELLYEISTRLEELEICCCIVAENHMSSRWSQFPAIRSLRFDTLEVPISELLEFIQKCPLLESLHWNRILGDVPISEICQLPTSYCPRLTNISIGTQYTPCLSENALVQILNSYPILTGFSIYESEFGPLALQSLRRHFGRLKILELGTSPHITDAMVLEALTSCRELIRFQVFSLGARSIVGAILGERRAGGDSRIDSQAENRHEWTCSNLRELKVFIGGLESMPTEQQQLVLHQIAKFKKLEVLNISYDDGKFHKHRTPHDGIGLRLDAGLDILRELRRLEVIAFNGLKQRIESQEIQWMLKEWPDLKQVRGVLHPIHSEHRKLAGSLRLRGVKVVS